MKKLLSMALSVIIAAGLSLGAFAAVKPEMLGSDNFDPILGNDGKTVTRLVKGEDRNYRVMGIYFADESKRELDFVNEARAKKKLAPLKWEKKLEEAAIQRALEQYVLFSHTRPDGSSWSTISAHANGENLAISYGGFFDAETVTEGWLNSDDHYSNIMGTGNVSKYFVSMAAACVETDKGTIWVQLFKADRKAFLSNKNKALEAPVEAPDTVKTLSTSKVTAKSITGALDDANALDGGVSLTLKGNGTLSTDVLKTAASWSKNNNTSVSFTVTTTVKSGSSIQGKLKIDPAKLSGKKAVKTGVYIEKSAVRSVSEIVERRYPDANFSVIKLEQSGSYGGMVQVAVKSDEWLEDTLLFYSCNEKTGKLKKLDIGEDDYSVDKNTYLYFNIDSGGYIVVSDEEL